MGRNHSGRVERSSLHCITLGKNNSLRTCILNAASITANNKHGWTLKPSPPKTLPFLPFVVSIWLSTPVAVQRQSGPKYLVQPETQWLVLVSVINRGLPPNPECQTPPTGGRIWCKTNTVKSSLFSCSIFVS